MATGHQRTLRHYRQASPKGILVSFHVNVRAKWCGTFVYVPGADRGGGGGGSHGAIFVIPPPPNLKSWIRPCVPSSVRVVIWIRPAQEADTSLDGLYPTTEKLDHSSIFRDSQGMNNTCTISNSVISVLALT